MPHLYLQIPVYSNTCLKRSLKLDKTKIALRNGSLMKVESVAECLEHSAILLTSLSSGPVLRHLNESSITSTEINL